MYITSKLNNKLKFFQYFSILKNNDILFISLVQKDFLKEISGKKKELSDFGFKFKTVNVKKIINGNIFFIYKKELDATDVKNFKYIIKNFPIIIFSYKNFFYSKKKINALISNISFFTQEVVCGNIRTNLYVNFFYKTYLQLQGYCKKTSD